MSTEDKEKPIDPARIEQIKRQSKDTRTMVREVASYIFLECGIYPSSNKVLTLIQQGSMGTINDELSQFWAQLKRRLSIRMDIPGLPSSVQEKLSGFGTELWQQASSEAKAAFEQDRLKIEAAMVAAEERETSAQQALEVLQQRFEASAASHEADSARYQTEIKRLEHEVAQATSQVETLRDELSRRASEHKAIEQQLATAQADFAKELAAQRELIRATEQRTEAAEKRALLEIDRARTEAKAAISEAEKHTNDATNKAEASAKENAKLQQRQAEQAQALTKCEMELAAATKEAAKSSALQEQINTLQEQLAQASARENEVVNNSGKLTTMVSDLLAKLEIQSKELDALKPKEKASRKPASGSEKP